MALAGVRARVHGALHAVHGSAPRPTDTPEVAALLEDADFAEQVSGTAEQEGLDADEAMLEAAGALREMSARHDEIVGSAWTRFGRWLTRGLDTIVDEEALEGLRRLDGQHSLIFLISHRSYLDEWVFPPALTAGGIEPAFGLAGANLDFFPLGTIARRTGIVHIRRATTGTPVYRLALRWFVGHLVGERSNLIWSIEGGRSRTGKLRPPRYGLLRYVVDAVEAADTREAYLVPISILYDQLPTHEVGTIAAEVGGGGKNPEDVRWFVDYVRGLRGRLGRVYLDIGEPLPLRERLAALGDGGQDRAVERIALEMCHRINRATPVSPNAAVCVAMLAADRALTLDETLGTVAPLAHYLRDRGWPIAGGAELANRATVRRALGELSDSGVLTSFSGGRQTVWGVAHDQHLVASVYRNSAVHALLVRAVTECALQAVAEPSEPSEPPGDVGTPLTRAALRLRELLKFDFFFADRDRFAVDVADELALLAPDEAGPDAVDADEARRRLKGAEWLVAPLVLRPFLDAYAVVADELVEAAPSVELDEKAFLRQCLHMARQQAMQRRLVSQESVSSEMLGTALRLARHRGLVERDAGRSDEELARRRRDFAAEVRAVRGHLRAIAAVTPDPVA